MNNMSFSFWSGSRSSVKRTRRKVFQRASSAAMEDATPTLRSKVKRKSRTGVRVSILCGESQVYASQSPARSKASHGAGFLSRAGNKPGLRGSLLYCSFPMKRKSKQDKRIMKGRAKKKSAALKVVAQAALPTRFGRFTIYGFKGRGPQDEAVALVRGKLNGKTAPLVRVHSQCLTGD